MKSTIILLLTFFFSSCSVLIPKIVSQRYAKHDGEVVPNFKIHDSNDSIVDFNKYSGNVIYLTIGEIGCGGSRIFLKHELPKLINTYQRFDSIVFVNILIEKDKDRWDHFINENKPLGVNLRYSGSRSSLYDLFSIDAVPFECVIDKSFTIAGFDLCGIGSEAAPYYALHEQDLKQGLKETFKLMKYDILKLF